MALRWFVHLACHVLGYSIDDRTNEEVVGLKTKGLSQQEEYPASSSSCSGFQMPLHYPRYTKGDYEIMEEWKVDLLLQQYGLSFKGTLHDKRAFAMGTFLWPDQY
ncbi:hypothetical protein PIB30_018229 [Stylosanthes scabra]|uniref:DUF7722 domain-containing protein n=1 Tax=Stylosanthes scabra TaxID=79078 RepID=A0ABU6V7Q2_9FABA|nr:hypothetical protein [Stylosanthes scabra]